MADSVEYVLILGIEKITRSTHSIYDSNLKRNVDVESHRDKSEIAKVVIRDPNLIRLIERGGQHLALVQDNETVVDNRIGKPRG